MTREEESMQWALRLEKALDRERAASSSKSPAY